MTLASPTFLLVCLAAIVLARFSSGVLARDLSLALVNLFAIVLVATSTTALVVLAALLVIVYALGRLILVAPARRAGAIIGVAVFVLWATLFLLKDPALLPAVNPFAGFPVAILGISYMTFRCISYLMEIGARPVGSPIRFMNYVLFFPAVTAGPIDRWRGFNDTVERPAEVAVLPALHRIANGFIKKFVLADNLAGLGVPEVSGLMLQGQASVPLLWLAAILQLFLIYLDFSGYCDIVIGVSRLMGVRVMENFNRPFVSKNVQEFWDRWHISLSSLMKDYVFTPVTKVIFTRTQRSVQFPLVVVTYFFVMVLIALWHGTSSGFLLFGVAQGGALVAYQLWRKNRPKAKKGAPAPHAALAVAPAIGTYLFVSLSLSLWLSTNDSWARYWAAMFGVSG